MPAPTDRQLIETALALLEAQPDVHGYLRTNRHFGYIGSSTACPVAVYLEDTTELRVDVHLDTWERQDSETGQTVTGVLPPKVRRVVQRFDVGELVDLMAPPRGKRRVSGCTCAAWRGLHELGCGFVPVEVDDVHRETCGGPYDCFCLDPVLTAGPVAALPYAGVPVQ